MGVRVARLLRAPTPQTFFLAILLISSCTIMSSLQSMASGSPDAIDALMRFKNSLSNSKSLANWDPNKSTPCNGHRANWIGVLCFDGKVRGLQLENMGLKGVADVDLLVSLPHFRTLSFMNNTLAGPIPDLKRLSTLRSVYLSYNHFSGEIPDDVFVGLRFLKKVMLSNNEFQGKIPSSLAALPKLVVLRLDGNKFNGLIPNFTQPTLKTINLSNNDLEGHIPESLSKMDPTDFLGNKNLCGPPLESCMAPSLTMATDNVTLSPPHTDIYKKNSHLLKFVLIILIIILILVIFISAIIIACSNRKRPSPLLDRTSSTMNISHRHHNSVIMRSLENNQQDPKLVAAAVANANSATKRTVMAGEGKLTFLKDDRERFDLPDLLKASAEILGSGTFGASYKATIHCDAMVVKRYKQMNSLGREDFHEHMRRLGRLVHPNLLPLVAYYYRKEEKLLVYDFVENGSLAFHLHGNHRNSNQSALDWPTRLKIIKGIAKGLTYLYKTLPSLVVPHGHLKSSNVVLGENFEPLMTDYGLLPAINLDHAEYLMMAYKSPEYAKMRRITKKTDVWSLGILILEILTGKFPENYLTQRYDPDADLASWVNQMIKEKRTSQVFDEEMGGVKNSKAELLKLLKIGVSCCEEDLERRLDLNEAFEKIEDLNHHDDHHAGDHLFSPIVVSGRKLSSDQDDSYISRAM
ncbi:pollen receptor-like kinase 4 [Humulus lupulus]|uniref:pollen receptor-like kinase 4 n=1 Tax=Humulus lupulus TaxID=3486 RepID=UPI002B40EEDA|nr:pollen receptor-like kinase 4 [Humulus lupulus]